jgi:hypothetical protein
MWLAGAVVLLFVVQKVQQSRAGPEPLAMTVWYAFGPYEDATRAVRSLGYARLAVFGPSLPTTMRHLAPLELL